MSQHADEAARRALELWDRGIIADPRPVSLVMFDEDPPEQHQPEWGHG